MVVEAVVLVTELAMNLEPMVEQEPTGIQHMAQVAVAVAVTVQLAEAEMERSMERVVRVAQVAAAEEQVLKALLLLRILLLR